MFAHNSMKKEIYGKHGFLICIPSAEF